MAEVLALSAAVVFGLVHFASGLLARRANSYAVAFLYRGLAAGNMSVVAPLSDVAAVALPVLAGVVLLGDRPTVLAWVGVGTALPALWLLPRTGGVLAAATVAVMARNGRCGAAVATQARGASVGDRRRRVDGHRAVPAGDA